MKTLLILAAIAGLSSIAGATSQYQALGNVAISSSTVSGGLGIWSRTVAQLQTLTPTTTGQIVYCSNCAAAGNAGTICVSTGSTAAYQWVLSTGTQCK